MSFKDTTQSQSGIMTPEFSLGQSVTNAASISTDQLITDTAEDTTEMSNEEEEVIEDGQDDQGKHDKNISSSLYSRNNGTTT